MRSAGPHDHGGWFRQEFKVLKNEGKSLEERFVLSPKSSIVIMFSQVLAPVLIGLIGLIEVAFAQSCAAQW